LMPVMTCGEAEGFKSLSKWVTTLAQIKKPFSTGDELQW